VESWDAIVSDAGTFQTRGCGIDAAARSGVICAGVVLGEEVPKYRVKA
jgi:hypothetical protein